MVPSSTCQISKVVAISSENINTKNGTHWTLKIYTALKKRIHKSIHKSHHEIDHLTLNLWVLFPVFMNFNEFVIPGWGNGSVGKVRMYSISITPLKMLSVVVHASNIRRKAAETGRCLGLTRLNKRLSQKVSQRSNPERYQL